MNYQELFRSFPILETERLLLRHITKDDAPDLLIMRSDPEVMRYIPRPVARDINDIYPYIDLLNSLLAAGERIHWGITLKDTRQLIGIIGFVHIKAEHYRAEVGYSLSRAFHRRGLMREALLRVIRYGFEHMALHTIEAIIDAENSASGALLLDTGFQQEACFREDFFYNNQFRNSIHFGLLRSAVDG